MVTALKRIGVRGKMLKVFQDLLWDRKNKVITQHGLTEEYEVEDGLDQGDSISPLLWRIFYNPLIHRMEKEKQGYQMQVRQPINMEDLKQEERKAATPVLAYMDDTTWLASSMREMQEITEIATSFYRLHEINTNQAKTKMIVLNRKDEGGKVDIKLNGEEVKITEKKEAIRILGSWINGFGNKKAQEKKIREATTTVVNTVARKKVNGEITRYILNQVLCPRLEYLMIDYV